MASERFEQGGDKRELTDIIYICNDLPCLYANISIVLTCVCNTTREPACMTHNYLLCTTPLDRRQ